MKFDAVSLHAVEDVLFADLLRSLGVVVHLRALRPGKSLVPGILIHTSLICFASICDQLLIASSSPMMAREYGCKIVRSLSLGKNDIDVGFRQAITIATWSFKLTSKARPCTGALGHGQTCESFL